VNLGDLASLVARGESEHLEFKRSTGSLSDGMKSVCAMLNSPLPGYVLFGINDRAEIVGQEISTRTLEEVATEQRKIEPPAFPDIEQVKLPNGRSVLTIRVPGGTGLYTYDGRPYHRIGPTTSRMPNHRYEQRLLEHLHASNRWERATAEGVSVGDLDHSEIIRTVEEAIRRQRLADPGTRDARELLIGLGLIEDGQLLNAAAVLFGRPTWLLSRYTQCLVRLARFRGTTKTEFVDSRQEIGNAFDLLVQAQEFLRSHLPVAGRIVPNRFERVDEPLYPPDAVREALSNAFCHRDYTAGAGSIGIAIYDDRLEISSPGPLPFGLTTEDLRQPHPSKPRNLLIAHAFYRRGIIEQWGAAHSR
jgi:ATP-dependent DNA helicase RecG